MFLLPQLPLEGSSTDSKICHHSYHWKGWDTGLWELCRTTTTTTLWNASEWSEPDGCGGALSWFTNIISCHRNISSDHIMWSDLFPKSHVSTATPTAATLDRLKIEFDFASSLWNGSKYGLHRTTKSCDIMSSLLSCPTILLLVNSQWWWHIKKRKVAVSEFQEQHQHSPHTTYALLIPNLPTCSGSATPNQNLPLSIPNLNQCHQIQWQPWQRQHHAVLD